MTDRSKCLKHKVRTNQSHSIPYPFFKSTSGAM